LIRHVLVVNCFNSALDAVMLFGLHVDLADGRIIQVKSRTEAVLRYMDSKTFQQKPPAST